MRAVLRPMSGPPEEVHGPYEGEHHDGGGARSTYPGPFVYAGLGILNAVCLLGGLALGWLLDSVAGTLPLFLMLGLVGGAALGVVATRAELRRYGR